MLLWFDLILFYACQEYSIECLSKIKSTHPGVIYAIYGAVCFQLVYISYDDFENIWILSYYHYHSTNMNH